MLDKADNDCILNVLVPYLSDSGNNDTSIVKHAMKTNADEIQKWLKPNNLFIFDRSFWDVLDFFFFFLANSLCLIWLKPRKNGTKCSIIANWALWIETLLDNINQLKSTLSVTCDKSVVFSWYSVSFTNKTYHHDITEILLKVALSTINQPEINYNPVNQSSL